ncbi:hypothetical protein [Sabulicella glaciei]|uniref:Uncharacterized protein n=1 Tax=Sabulicella glaciei TaxID=2984948 RepID=A0ABT3P0U1_9PROT|nr:hypothetical protein [Roseococcus sp. MDT2-1-1]MCW8088038.1 hypothetical protein [Roseococcus sp. MDT2-1-1]
MQANVSSRPPLCCGAASSTPPALAAALARSDLSPELRAFLLDLQTWSRQRNLTPRQRAACKRIATAPDFTAVNRAALARLPEVLARLLPGGGARGAEWHAGSLRGEAGNSLRVRLRGKRAGAWCDFATGEKGGDPVSLAAAVAILSQEDAACELARMLGVGGCFP